MQTLANRAVPAILAAALLAGCAGAGGPVATGAPLGARPVFDVAPGAAPDRQLIVVDLRLGPGAAGAAHYHPWEEFLYVIEGSALVELAGAPPREVGVGESFVIPPRVVHTPRAGPQGVRALVVRLHRQGDPVSIEAEP